MKILRLSWIFIVCGLALGLMTVWSSAAPKTVDAIALRGGSWVFCNCVATGSCSSEYSEYDCEGGSLPTCHPDTPAEGNRCQYNGSHGGCTGPEKCTKKTNPIPQEECFQVG